MTVTADWALKINDLPLFGVCFLQLILSTSSCTFCFLFCPLILWSLQFFCTRSLLAFWLLWDWLRTTLAWHSGCGRAVWLPTSWFLLSSTGIDTLQSRLDSIRSQISSRKHSTRHHQKQQQLQQRRAGTRSVLLLLFVGFTHVWLFPWVTFGYATCYKLNVAVFNCGLLFVSWWGVGGCPVWCRFGWNVPLHFSKPILMFWFMLLWVSCECNLQDISNDDNQDDLRALVNKEHKT